MYTIRRFNIDGETYLNAEDVLHSILETLRWLPITKEQKEFACKDILEECENEHLAKEFKKVFWDFEADYDKT